MARRTARRATVRPELSDAFLLEIDRTFEALRARPTSIAEVEHGVRGALCDTFPYKVHPPLREDGEVRLVAVYHASRDPGRWEDRWQ